MPFLFIFAIILIVIAVLIFVGTALIPKGADNAVGDKRIGHFAGWVTVGLALALVFFSSFTTVGTRNVGIITEFGSTAGHLSNGLHLIAPWANVTEMDAAIQTDSYQDGSSCVGVRIANQQTGCAHITIQWRIKPGAADELYQNYRTFDHVRNALVTREFTAAINNQLSNYNPLNSIAFGTPSSGATPNPSLSTIADRIANQMRSEIGDRIEVLHVFLPLLTFDDATQSKINQLQQQIAQTRVAEQQVLTNAAQAKANDALARSVNTSPNVLVAECLNTLNLMVKNGQTVPPGFSCWPGNSVSGLIVNTKK